MTLFAMVLLSIPSGRAIADEDCYYVADSYACEWNYGGEECGTHITDVTLAGGLIFVTGVEACRTYADGQYNHSSWTVWAPVLFVAWGENDDPGHYQCYLYVGAVTDVVVPCPVPPPNPGWGNLLP